MRPSSLEVWFQLTLVHTPIMRYLSKRETDALLPQPDYDGDESVVMIVHQGRRS